MSDGGWGGLREEWRNMEGVRNIETKGQRGREGEEEREGVVISTVKQGNLERNNVIYNRWLNHLASVFLCNTRTKWCQKQHQKQAQLT